MRPDLGLAFPEVMDVLAVKHRDIDIAVFVPHCPARPNFQFRIGPGILAMDFRILIKGGSVVDGRGEPAFLADVRIAHGRIAEIGQGLEAGTGERVVDATGCYVAPGFIETHNHWDGGVWWTPDLEPLPAYGATTSINGNCGISYEARRTEAAKHTVYASGCRSWYLDAEGVPQVWPWSYDYFQEVMPRPNLEDYELSRFETVQEQA